MTVNPTPSPSRRLLGVCLGLSSLIIAALALPGSAGADPAPPQFTVAADTPLPLQVDRMELLRDPSGSLGLADVRAPGVESGFMPAPPGVPNLGVGRDAVWARFAVHNASDQPLDLLLVLAEPRISQVAFWALDDAGRLLAERRDGRFADPADRDRSHRWFLFELPMPADGTATLYLRVTSDTGRLLDLRLTDHTRLAAADRAAYGWLALYFGALLFMLAYNSLLLLQLRDPAYLWLCCVIAGGSIWVVEREGLLTTLIWQLWPAQLSGIVAGASIGFIGVFLFPVAYLQLARQAPRWMLVHWLLALLSASLPLLALWLPHFAYTMTSALGAICAPVAVVAGLLVVRRQPRTALWYLVSWLPMLIAMVILPLVNYGLLPPGPSLRSLPYLGLLLMLLLLSVAQADRVNALRREAERARAALAHNEQRLTELVDERTRELATARDRAEAANRAKTRFLANMSHELRTPLNAVLGGVELLGRSPRLGTQERDQCGLIQRGGRHLLGLIEDLLDIARIEHGHLRPVLAPVALQPLLDDLVAVTRRQAEAKGLAFDTRLALDLPAQVYTDERRMRQVLQNLLDNAVKYTDTGSVRFTADFDPVAPVSADGKTLLLQFTVSDTGRGIAAADRERLFAPFEQYDPAQHTGGLGLGLAICRELVGVLGGELSLDSVPGRGSRFCVRVPMRWVTATQGRDASGPDQAPVTGYAGPRRHILVIDDSHVNRLLMAGLLEQLGFTVDTAEDARSALAMAQRQPPDLVITDLRMPEVCGYAAVWQLREALACPDLPAIAASASPLPALEDAAELGFDAFLLKPVEFDALRAVLGDCLGLAWVHDDAGASSRSSA